MPELRLNERVIISRLSVSVIAFRANCFPSIQHYPASEAQFHHPRRLSIGICTSNKSDCTSPLHSARAPAHHRRFGKNPEHKWMSVHERLFDVFRYGLEDVVEISLIWKIKKGLEEHARLLEAAKKGCEASLFDLFSLRVRIPQNAN